jgi:hypothetical protein
MMSIEEGRQLDDCQSLLNVGNPPGGPMSKVDTVLLALRLLHRRLKGQVANVRKAVADIDPDAPKRKGRAKANGHTQPTASAEDEGVCDFDAIDADLAKDKANDKKAAAGVR